MSDRANALREVGRSLPSIDARAKIDGTAVYASDLVFADMLHAKVLRSPHAHARIVAIDASAALAMPGVAAVATAADLNGLDPYFGNFIRDQPVLAMGKVRFAGEPVAAVAAIDEATAYRALEAIRVDYEPLETLATMDAALRPDAAPIFDRIHDHALPPAPAHSRYVQEPEPNILFRYDFAVGDAETELAACARVFEETYRFARLSHYALEPHVTIAAPAGAGVEVWSNNQDPFLLRQDIARIFRMPFDAVRFHGGLIGGGFGAKSYCKVEPIAVLLARKTGRIVRYALTMAESMTTVCEHGAEMRVRTGIDAECRTIARAVDVRLDGGAYADASPSVAMRIGTRFGGPYRWRALSVRVDTIRTTTIPAGSFRGFGAAHTTWASESQVDTIARAIGEDPIAFRRRNVVAAGEMVVPGEAKLDCDYRAGLDVIAAQIGADRPRAPETGIGVALALKSAGSAHRADATVRISGAGDIVVATGVSEIGQGHRTIMAQIAAEILGVPSETIRVEHIDTGATPYDSGTHASCGATLAGVAIAEAAKNARANLLEFAASRLGIPAAELDFRDRRVVRRGEALPLASIAPDAAARMFEGSATTKTPGGAHFWMPAWAAAEVSVDRETGIFKVNRLLVGIDAGKAVNPLNCAGQAEGGAIQGFGQAMFEELGTPEPLKYRVPRMTDIPAKFEALVFEHGMGPGAFGIKGIGESGNLPIPAAIANAIHDAVGARVVDLPITPERVYAAMSCRQPDDM